MIFREFGVRIGSMFRVVLEMERFHGFHCRLSGIGKIRIPCPGIQSSHQSGQRKVYTYVNLTEKKIIKIKQFLKPENSKKKKRFKIQVVIDCNKTVSKSRALQAERENERD